MLVRFNKSFTNYYWWGVVKMEYLEKLVIHLDEEDRNVLPKWRTRCIDLFNCKIKDVLRDYHMRRFGNDGIDPQ